MEAKTQSPPKHGPRPVVVDAEPCTLGREINFKGTIEVHRPGKTETGRVMERLLGRRGNPAP